MREIEIRVDGHSYVGPIKGPRGREPYDFENLWPLTHERRHVLTIGAGRGVCGRARERRRAHDFDAAPIRQTVLAGVVRSTQPTQRAPGRRDIDRRVVSGGAD